jgi:hypothetical protein
VVLAHRGQPVRLVLLGVPLRADPEEAAVEQAHRAAQEALAWEAGAVEILRRTVAQARKGAGEVDHLVELLAIAALAPAVVVAVLLAPRCVGAGGLDMAHRIGADPDVLPRGRDGEGADAVEDLGVGELAAVLVEVLEAATPSAADDPRRRAVDAA